jgi:hypothetical protein
VVSAKTDPITDIMSSMSNYDAVLLAAQKQASRDRDEADLKYGRATAEEIDRRNSIFFRAGIDPRDIKIDPRDLHWVD